MTRDPHEQPRSMSHHDAVIEAGEIRDGFMIDELGRCIYFPAIGPARLLPAPKDEAILRARIKWCAGAGWILCASALAGYTYWLKAPGYEAIIFVLIAIASRQIGASCLARRLPQIDYRTITHAQAWAAWMAKQSYGWLGAAILGNFAGAIVLAVPFTLQLRAGATIWNEVTSLESAIRSYGFSAASLVFVPFYLLDVRRLILALRHKTQRASPRMV